MEDRMLRSLQNTLAIRKKDIGFYYLDKNLKEDMRVPTNGDVFRDYVTNMSNEFNKSIEKVKSITNMKKYFNTTEKIKDDATSGYLISLKNIANSCGSDNITDILENKLSIRGISISEKADEIMKFTRNSKVDKFIEKAMSFKFLNIFDKILPWIGRKMNVDTILYSKSDYKRECAASDLAIDLAVSTIGPKVKDKRIYILPIISSLSNLAGSFLYDNSHPKVKEYLDNKARTRLAMTMAMGTVLSMQSRMFKVSPRKKTKKLNKNNRNIIDFEKVIKGRTRGIGIKSKDKSTQKLIRGVKLKQSKPYSNLISMYHNNPKSIKTNNSQMHHDRGRLDAKLQGSQTDNSNKNNFTINITGINKSTQEMMNEIVPEIMHRMKNISVA